VTRFRRRALRVIMSLNAYVDQVFTPSRSTAASRSSRAVDRITQSGGLVDTLLRRILIQGWPDKTLSFLTWVGRRNAMLP
jgi:hypothetical protein